MSGAGDPLDYTNRYNTPLSPDQEQGYQQWIQLQSALNHRDMSGDNYNYDMRGAYANGAAQSGGNMHWPDTFKKPNHPSFSDQSQYHGADGTQGGSWSQDPAGAWQFVPGPTNLQLHGPAGLRNYFQRGDPDVKLVLPPGPTSMLDYVKGTLANT
jgi:hypothetical protein